MMPRDAKQKPHAKLPCQQHRASARSSVPQSSSCHPITVHAAPRQAARAD
jgi:hypothetical protein